MRTYGSYLIKGLLVTMFFVALSGVSDAGWVETRQDGSKTYISKGKALNQDRKGWSIIDVNKGQISMGQSERKVYSTGSVDQYCKSMSDMMTKMMEGMPPEQKKMMEEMRQMTPPEAKPIKVTVAKQGPGGIIAGYKTVKYSIHVDGIPQAEVWVANNASLDKEVKGFGKKVNEIMGKFDKCMTQGMQMGATVITFHDSAEYKDLVENHWVLREISGMETTTDVKEIKQESIPDSKFQPPTDYKKISIGDLFMAQMGGRETRETR